MQLLSLLIDGTELLDQLHSACADKVAKSLRTRNGCTGPRIVKALFEDRAGPLSADVTKALDEPGQSLVRTPLEDAR